MMALAHPPAQGKIFELGGPEVVSLREIYGRLFRYTGRRRRLVNMSFGMAKMKARVLGLFPNPILTTDQVESLRTDSIVTKGALTLEDLALTPTSMDIVLPRYLETYRSGGRFGAQNAA